MVYVLQYLPGYEKQIFETKRKTGYSIQYISQLHFLCPRLNLAITMVGVELMLTWSHLFFSIHFIRNQVAPNLITINVMVTVSMNDLGTQ